jgi:hypothetical protein
LKPDPNCWVLKHRELNHFFQIWTRSFIGEKFHTVGIFKKNSVKKFNDFLRRESSIFDNFKKSKKPSHFYIWFKEVAKKI